MKKLTYFFLSLVTFALTTALVEGQQRQFPTSVDNETYSSGRIEWQSDYNGAVALSQRTSKPIVILFTGTTWCPACIQLEKNVLTKPEFANGVGDKFIFLKAEFPRNSADAMGSSPHKFLVDRYHVDRFPTIIVVDAGGQELFRVNYQSGGPDTYINELISKLNQYRSRAPAPTYSY